MIVSMAIAVLPVWRSPMISSRWPRPIGIIESMAFRPVCIGSFPRWPFAPPRALEEAAGALDRVALDDLLPGAEEHGADVVGLEVQGQARHVVGQLEHL